MSSVTLNHEQVRSPGLHACVSARFCPSDMTVVGSILGPCCFEQQILMNIFNPHCRCLTFICFPRQMEINVVKKRHRTRSKGVRGVCGFHASVAYMDILKEELLADCLLQF